MALDGIQGPEGYAYDFGQDERRNSFQIESGFLRAAADGFRYFEAAPTVEYVDALRKERDQLVTRLKEMILFLKDVQGLEARALRESLETTLATINLPTDNNPNTIT